jgi:hypothetical protein
MQKKGNRYGTHRVIEPQGVLPQPARKLDNDMSKIYDNEILCDVITLNIDSASFKVILDKAEGHEKKSRKSCWASSPSRANTGIPDRFGRDVYRSRGAHRRGVTGADRPAGRRQDRQPGQPQPDAVANR